MASWPSDETLCPGMPSCRNVPRCITKNVLSRLSVALVRTMRAGSRAARPGSGTPQAARRSEPSHARQPRHTPGRASPRRLCAVWCREDRRVGPLEPEGGGPTHVGARVSEHRCLFVGRHAATCQRFERFGASARASGCRSATNAPKRLASPVSLSSSGDLRISVRGIGQHDSRGCGLMSRNSRTCLS